MLSPQESIISILPDFIDWGRNLLLVHNLNGLNACHILHLNVLILPERVFRLPYLLFPLLSFENAAEKEPLDGSHERE